MASRASCQRRYSRGGWRACSPFPIHSCTFLPAGSPVPGWNNAQGLPWCRTKGFAPEQTAWPCLCSQPDVRWLRWRFYPGTDSVTEDLQAVSRLSGCENMLSRYTETEAGEFKKLWVSSPVVCGAGCSGPVSCCGAGNAELPCQPAWEGFLGEGV